MPNYANGKIYTIRFHNSNEIYIGSTIQSLAVRFGGHKIMNSCSLYQIIHNKYDGKWDECYYELYENYNCNNKEELHKKEGEVIRLFKNDENYNCINLKIAGRTNKEYYIDNLEKIKKQHKQHRIDNVDKIKEHKKQYRIDNLEKIKEQKKQYNEKNPEYMKQYRKQYMLDNADKLKEDKKLYYQKNKEKISIKNKEKITCDCGSCINKGDLSQHYKSKKHQNYLASLPTSATMIRNSDESNTQFVSI
jgi:hypothetical protein